MISEHCLVKLGDYLIPLIGIPPNSGQQRCEWCDGTFALWEVELIGNQFVCAKCRYNFRKKYNEAA